MLNHLRSRVLKSLKRPVRPLLDRVDEWQRARQLARGVAALRNQVRAGQIATSLITDLRTAWGNTAWSADASFIIELVNRTLTSPGPFLDCGSGLSTLIVGVIAEQRGTRVWSLEQDRAWYERMRAARACRKVFPTSVRAA